MPRGRQQREDPGDAPDLGGGSFFYRILNSEFQAKVAPSCTLNRNLAVAVDYDVYKYCV